MANPHSTVIYVEPNSMDSNTMLSGATRFEKAPSLEDYCIALNLEVEVCSRNRTGNDVQSEVLIVSWDNKNDKVSFMGGTKIGGYHYDEANGAPTRKSRLDPDGIHKDSIYNALTTYYADMYVGDLVDYGTTEMVGIKSVNIEYLKSCVPTITIQFTDVRGLSLFQPTELSRFNTFKGINGIDISNVAQSFFQCFYKMPLPKFTIYIKGFYGEPVSYEMMCDKFDTDFNSETGNFDCTAHFIGYSYSFMTDVSLDALICAPYSDYVGKDYWQQKVDNGEFFVYDKYKNPISMPTLYDVKSNIEKILAQSDKEMQDTSVTSEEQTHEEEILELKRILEAYSGWYEALFPIIQEKYGKEYCFLFKENGEDGCYYRIVILTNNDSIDKPNLSEDYSQYSDAFKKINKDLYSTIENYNNKETSYKKLNNVSLDFSSYTRQALFNDCYTVNNGVKMNGFSKDCSLPTDEVISVMYTENNRDILPRIIYNTDGTNQYKDAFVIEVEYGDIKKRINALQSDANRDVDDKTKEKAIREHNQNMLSKMNWYPTIENFTRIMLAHLETLMAMMYKVSDEIGSNRHASDVGVTTKDLSDINQSDKDPIVPPFPRVTEEVVGDDGITKIEDKWVGDLSNDSWKEINIVNGLLNAVEVIAALEKKDKEVLESALNAENEAKQLVKYPLTPFDFFATKKIYGTETDIVDDINAFAGKVAMRMYTILALNRFRWDTVKDFTKTLAEIEAENFKDSVVINRKLLDLLDDGNNQAAISSDKIMTLIKNNTPIMEGDAIPWGKRILFGPNYELNGYKTRSDANIYPVQNFSFSELNENCQVLKRENSDITTKGIVVNSDTFHKLCDSSNDSVFNSLYIENDYKKIETILDSSMSTDENTYKPIYERLKTAFFNGGEFSSFITTSGRTSFNAKVGVPKNATQRTGLVTDGDSLYFGEGEKNRKYYKLTADDAKKYAEEAYNGNIVSFTLTEAFGYTKTNNGYAKDDKNSFFLNEKFTFQNIKQRKLMQLFVMSLNCIDYKKLCEKLNCNNTFVYVPKLAALQFGAILAEGGSNGKLNIGKVNNGLGINVSGCIQTYLDSITPCARIAYIKYFRKWADGSYSNIMNLNKESYYSATFTKDGNVRRLFNENNKYIINLTNSLMAPVILCNTNSRDDAVPHIINESVVKTYLDAFITKLKQLYHINYHEDENGNVTQITETPKNSTKDMKKELYRYLKLLYDKWVPSNGFETWNYEKFFDYEDKSKKRGHLFHFIDSYYNKIGDKLLINPSKLAEKLSAAFDDNSGDISIMMLGFMADIYAQNKCMLLSLQNFMDLSNREEMYNMFRPISFNEMKSPNKHPDFVVVYPYEPSKYLNISNSEYNNDSFMLNTEYETPQAIRSRGSNEKNYYRIPAFGVTYGKQYQSYFKKINVNTKSPIATQQSILAKHSILRNIHNDKPNGTVGQDLYDVYTTQSYTCTVEMMGCAWVQPLMYFVLLNVPMFRGSYMIFKVTHRIVPGDMSTTFMGTRMCNVANTLVKDMFIDESDFTGSNEQYEISSRQRAANVDNDCPYKVYPLVEDYDGNGNDIESAMAAMSLLINNYGFSKQAAAGICGNIYKESTWRLHVTNSIGAFGLCQWLTDRKQLLLKKYGTKPTFSEQIEYINYEWNNESCAKNYKNKLLKAETPEAAAEIVMNYFERPSKDEKATTISGRKAKALEYFKNYGKTEPSVKNTTNADDKKLNDTDIRGLFINAVSKSCGTTKAIKNASNINYENVSLTKSKQRLIKIIGDGNDLSVVFDIILNGYYDYVQTLYWVSKTDFSTPPNALFVEVSNNVQPNNRRIIVTNNESSPQAYNKKADISGANKSLLMSLKKKYGNNTKLLNQEVPQSVNGNISNAIGGLNIANCDSVVGGDDIRNYNGPSSNSSWAKAVESMGKWYESNVYTYQQTPQTRPNPQRGTGNRKYYNCSLVNGTVADDCSGFVSACLQYFGVFKSGNNGGVSPSSSAFASKDLLLKKGFKSFKFDKGAVKPYDIVAKKGHVEIIANEKAYTENGTKSWSWGSVHNGKNGNSPMPAPTSKDEYTVIWRYVGNGKA